ncbi:MAG: LptF/LptG family permease [Planctomycetota bacterium]
MSLLDRYVTRTFFAVFLTALVVFSIGIVTLDFFARASVFVDSDGLESQLASGYSRLELIARFYLAYLPYVLKDTLGFVSVAAGMFTVTHLLRNNEVQPVLAAGRSARRMFMPVFACGLLIAFAQIAFQELVIPGLNREQIVLKRLFSGERSDGVDRLPHLRDGRGRVTRAGFYSFQDQSLRDVVIAQPWNDKGSVETWFVDRLEPDGEQWRAAAPVRILPAGISAVGRSLPTGSPVDLGVSPNDVEALTAERGMAELNYSQLKALLEKFPDRRNLQVALQRQLARPMSSFILLLCGVPILLGLSGRSLVLGAAVAFGVSATFYFLEIFMTSLGDRGELPPVVAVWFPSVLFFSIGLSRLMTIRT